MKKNFLCTVKHDLINRPEKINQLNGWLFIVINTAKAIIDSNDKDKLSYLNEFSNCPDTQAIQLKFDRVQGMFGQQSLLRVQRSNYLYLCSLVANFLKQQLTNDDRKLIKQYCLIDHYLVYDE